MCLTVQQSIWAGSCPTVHQPFWAVLIPAINMSDIWLGEFPWFSPQLLLVSAGAAPICQGHYLHTTPRCSYHDCIRLARGWRLLNWKSPHLEHFLTHSPVCISLLESDKSTTLFLGNFFKMNWYFFFSGDWLKWKIFPNDHEKKTKRFAFKEVMQSICENKWISESEKIIF